MFSIDQCLPSPRTPFERENPRAYLTRLWREEGLLHEFVHAAWLLGYSVTCYWDGEEVMPRLERFH